MPRLPHNLVPVKQTIPKHVRYYTEKAARVKALSNTPGSAYLESVYNRAARMAREGKPLSEINNLFATAKETLIRNGAIVPRTAASTLQLALNMRRAQNVANREERAERRETIRQPNRVRLTRVRVGVPASTTLNNYILGYIEQIKHKKELLVAFLKKMYEQGYYYNPATKKWKLRKR